MLYSTRHSLALVQACLYRLRARWPGRSLGLLLLTGVALVLSACGSASTQAIAKTAPTPELALTAGEALRRDAQQYAAEMGVDVDEAVRRLQIQDEIGELNATLAANEQDTFAGLWIEHQPDFRVIVQFTRGGKRTIRPYLKEKSFAPLIQVREVRYTLLELEGIRANAQRELDKLDFDVTPLLSVPHNRVEVSVSDQAWVEGELRRVGAQLPDGVALVEVEGAPTARDRDLLLTPPVPGIAFPRQKPTEGMRVSMGAELIGTLLLEEGCLHVRSSYDGATVLPVWPPEFTLRAEGDEVLVIDGGGQVAARVDDEVYMGGGHGGVSDEWVLGQIPSACRGAYWIVGEGVRLNLRTDSELFSLDVISGDGRSLLYLRKKPVLDEWAQESDPLTGTLVWYEYQRCLFVQRAPVDYMPLWPPDYEARIEDGEVELVDGSGQVVARSGAEVRLSGGAIPSSWESDDYRQLYYELPGDCYGPYWVVGDD